MHEYIEKKRRVKCTRAKYCTWGTIIGIHVSSCVRMLMEIDEPNKNMQEVEQNSKDQRTHENSSF